MSRLTRTLCSLTVLTCLFAASVVRSQEPALKIVVLEGEDGVNIIDKKTAVKPVVEVRDKNDLPVAGVIVTFTIVATSGAKLATFGSGQAEYTMTTNALGRATVDSVRLVGKGAIKIQVTANYQGQIVTTTVNQTNFANAAEAARAAKNQNQQNQQGNNTGNQLAGNGGGSAGAGAGGGSGAGAGGGSAAGAAGGGAHIGLIAGLAAAGAGTVVAKQQYDKHKCDSLAQDYVNSLNSATNTCNSYVNASYNTWYSQCQRAFGQSISLLGQLCSCGGGSGGQLNQYISQGSDIGFGLTTPSSCY